MSLDKNLDQVFDELKPVFDSLWEKLPQKYKDLAEKSFENVVDLAKQLVVAKLANDEVAAKRTRESLEHAINALLSTIVSGINALENPVKEIVSGLALRVLGSLITRLFALVKE